MSPLGLGGTLSGIDGYTPVGKLLSSSTNGAASGIANFVVRKISSAVLDATRDAIEQVAGMIGRATAPNLNSTWFSSTYWRVAALAAMLTIPFLCAAAVQAVARADLGLLARAAFGYLPLAVLGVSLAAPLTMLLLAATDQMSAAVSAGAAGGGARFLDHAAVVAGALASEESPFFAVIVGLLAVMAAIGLAVELLVRAAAVYVVVLMLPLAFAALVWPARRVWAARLVELLASLILAKFVIVAVLSLASAALASTGAGVGQLLVAMSLLVLASFAPWALLRILPFTELAAGAAGVLRNELPHAHGGASATKAFRSLDAALNLPARLREQARYAEGGGEAGPATGAGTGHETDLANFSTPHFDEPADAGASTPPDGELANHATPHFESRDGQPGEAADEPPSYVVPQAWRGRERIRLDHQLLGPPAPSEHLPEQQP